MNNNNFYINKIKCLYKDSIISLALPEGNELRVQTAICSFLEDKVVDTIVCFADEKKLSAFLEDRGFQRKDFADRVHFVKKGEFDSLTAQVLQESYAARNKPLSPEKCSELSSLPLYQAGALLTKQQVQASVAGVHATTADVIRAALQTVGLKSDCKTLSGLFIMNKQNENLFFSDAAVTIRPDANQLCEIAISTCHSFLAVEPEVEPKVAFLSFSTNGSANHEEVDKVHQACQLFQKRKPQIQCIGEVQFDTAWDEEIRLRKFPESCMQGRANIFIFPDLASANIAYKITQRIGQYAAYGPILQGLNRAYSDLSRGANVDDIVKSAYINLCRNHSLL